MPAQATLSTASFAPLPTAPEAPKNTTLSNAPLSISLTIPDLPYDNSAPDPASPSPQPALRAQTPAADLHRPPPAQPMQVDPTDQPGTPTPQAGNDPIHLDGGEADNDSTPMRALLANNKEYQNTLKTNRAGPRDPLDKYLKDPTPKVHVAHPAAAYDFVETKKIDEWDTYPTNKLLAIPFGFEARQQTRHNSIRARILAAVVEITQAEQVGVAIPGPEDRIITYRNETPIAFLIHSLTKQQAQSLLQRGTWISAEISFRVLTVKPTSPDYLFTLDGLSTVGVQAVVQMILTKWAADNIQATLTKIVREANARSTYQIDLQNFFDSVTVQCLKVIKNKILVPKFNVYANGELIPNHVVWTQIRDVLRDLSYDTAMLGQGTTEQGPYDCNICHAADHPYGLCTFPLIKGWNGPSGADEFTSESGRDGRNRALIKFNRRK